MEKIIISDTTCLILLEKLGRLELLRISKELLNAILLKGGEQLLP